MILRPSTLLAFHDLLKKRRSCLLYLSSSKRKPGPKGPLRAVIPAIVEWKRRNPRFGCPQIAQQINQALGIEIDKDVVRHILAAHYRPGPGGGVPSWLTFLGHTKNSVCSVDLFRPEPVLLQNHWVLIVTDQFTHRIIGFGVHTGEGDGAALWRMFNRAISRASPPRSLSTAHDPLFQYHRWKANLRILDSEDIKTVPCKSLSHAFVLEKKRAEFRAHYNECRVHGSLDGNTPATFGGECVTKQAALSRFRRETHCHGLHQLPVAA